MSNGRSGGLESVSSIDSDKAPAVFYGWRIVGLTTLCQFIAVGCTSYIFGLYVESIAEEFNASRLSISAGMAAVLLTMTLIAPALGHWLDKHSIRNTMTLGALLMCLGFFTLSRATALWQMAIALVLLVGIGAAMLGHLPSSKLVTNWFSTHRGKAMGISTLGTSLGGFILPPLIAGLIVSFGWRASLVFLSILILVVVVPLVFVTVKNRPQDMGLSVDGVKPTDVMPEVEPIQDVQVGSLIKHPSFWGIGLSVGFMASAGTLLLTHFAAYAAEYDIAATGAALVISSYSASAIAGKLLFGYLADHFSLSRLLQVAIVLKGALWFVFLGPNDLSYFVIGGAAVGLGAGATMPLWNALVGACFGRMVFARVMGYMGLILLPLIMIPVPIGGQVFDSTGSYLPIFQYALLLFPMAFLATLLIRVPPVQPAG